MTLNRSLLATAILIGLASTGFAQGYGDTTKETNAKNETMKNETTSSEKEDMTSTLRTLEIRVNDAFKNQDSKTFLSIVDPDAWSIDAMGFTPVSEVAGMIKDVVVKSYSIEGYKVKKLGSHLYVAGYTWKGESSYKGQTYPPVTYCSTIWSKEGKDWKAVFHQESIPMEGMQPSAAASH